MRGMKGVFSVQQTLYFAFGVIILSSVIVIMNSFYMTTQPLSSEIGMRDVLKTINTGVLKLYLEAEYSSSESSTVFLNLPRKISGLKYRIEYNQSSAEFCFVFPEEYCEHIYLLNENVSINASIDSSDDVHYARYENESIRVV